MVLLPDSPGPVVLLFCCFGIFCVGCGFRFFLFKKKKIDSEKKIESLGKIQCVKYTNELYMCAEQEIEKKQCFFFLKLGGRVECLRLSRGIFFLRGQTK
jgi:hypothetical protein